MKKLCSLIATVLILPVCQGQYSYDIVNSQAAGSIKSIVSDNSSNIIITGTFTNNITFGSFTLTNNITPPGYLGTSYIAKRLPGGTYAWAKAITLLPITGANYSNVSIADVETDAAGNVYITGQYYGKISLGGINLTSVKDGPNHSFDAFTAKMSATGSFIWAKSEGSNESEHIRALTLDNQGNVFATGRTIYKVYKNTYVCSSLGPNPILQNTVIPAVYLVKYNASGSKQWEKKFFNSQANATTCGLADGGMNLATDGTNVFLSGHVSGTVSLGAISLSAPNNHRGFIAKFNGSGNVLWANQAAGGSYNSIYGVGDGLFVHPSGDVYMSGIIHDSLSFGGVSITTPVSRGYLAKFSSSGVCQWAAIPIGICYGLIDLPTGNLAMLTRHGNAPSPGYGIKEISTATGATVDSVIAATISTPPSLSHWSGLARTSSGFVFSEMLGGSYELGGTTIASVGTNDMVLVRYTAPAFRMAPSGNVAESLLAIYPNPATDHITLQKKGNEVIGNVAIYDLSGRVMYQKHIPNAATIVNVEQFPQGLYYLKYDQSALTRFFKQ